MLDLLARFHCEIVTALYGRWVVHLQYTEYKSTLRLQGT